MRVAFGLDARPSVPEEPTRYFTLKNGHKYPFAGVQFVGAPTAEEIKPICEELEIDLESGKFPVTRQAASEEDQGPFRLGPDGRVYNKHFEEVAGPTGQVVDDDSQEYFSQQQVAEPMPRPEEFETYVDYEDALLGWKGRVEAGLSGIKLPSIVGSYYARPYALDAELVLQGKKPLSDLEGEACEEGDEKDNPSETERVHWSEWQRTLIADEPQPSEFSSFGEYDVALQRWAQLCTRHLESVPPHPSFFEKMMGLQTVKVSSAIHKRRTKKHDIRTLFEIHRFAHATSSSKKWEEMDTAQRQPLTVAVRKMEVELREGRIELGNQQQQQQQQTEGNRENFLVSRGLSPFPRLHGVLQSTPRDSYLGQVDNSKKKKCPSLLPVERHVSPEERLEMQDCASTVHGRSVWFPPPQFDIPSGEALKFNISQRAGFEMYKAELNNLTLSEQFSSLEAWYQPTVHHQHWESLLEECEKVMLQAKHVVDREQLVEMLNIGVPYDMWIDWLSADGRLSKVLKAVSPQNFVKLVNLVEDELPLDEWMWSNSNTPSQSVLVNRKGTFTTRLSTPTSRVNEATEHVLTGHSRVTVALRGSLLVIREVSRDIPPITLNFNKSMKKRPLYFSLRGCRVEKVDDQPRVITIVLATNQRLILTLLSEPSDNNSSTQVNTAALVVHRAQLWRRDLAIASQLPKRKGRKITLFNRKLSHILVSAMLNERRVQVYLSQVKLSANTETFARLAMLLRYGKYGIDSKVYPYSQQHHAASMAAFGEDGADVINNILWTHYVRIMKEDSVSPLCDNAKFKEALDQMEREILVFVDSSTYGVPHLLRDIISNLKHSHSRTLSDLCRITLVQLITGQPNELQTQLMSVQTGLVPGLLLCAKSKRRAQREAAKELFRLLSVAPWTQVVIGHYNQQDNSITEDLLEFSSPTQPDSSLCVSEWLEAVLPETSSSRGSVLNSFIFAQRVFYDLVVFVRENGKSGHVSSLVAGDAMVPIARRCVKLGLIEVKDIVKTNSILKALQGADNLLVLPTHLFLLMEMVANNVVGDPRLSIRLLNTVRHLLKHPKVYQVIKGNRQFYSQLNTICRNNSAWFGLNRCAWRLLFQVVRFHKDSLSDMTKTREFEQTLNIVHASAGVHVTSNGLRCLALLLTLKEYEAQHKMTGRDIVPEAVSKHFDSVSRQICKQIVEKSKFIKFHLVYRKLCDSEHRYTPAASFQSLAKLFHVFTTSPTCDKLIAHLRAETKKSQEQGEGYMTGLDHIKSMFSSDQSPLPRG